MPIKPAHLAFNNPNARLDNTNGRAYPLPFPADVVGIHHKIVKYLNVVRSPRYKASPIATYCNIYATDFAHGMGVYLPRVWWMPKALEIIQAGGSPPVVYGGTVWEMNANMLHEWLERWGLTFGWEKADFTTVQHAVNSGAVGVICAARKDPARPGHISVVVPESKEHGKAAWDGETVVAPLQCQAGATNRNYWTGAGWWSASQLYRAVGSWYCVPEAEKVEA